MDTSIYNSIFNGESVTEEYIPACEKLLKALDATGKDYESQLWEDAAFEFDKTPKKEWCIHLIKVAQTIDKRNRRRLANGSKI